MAKDKKPRSKLGLLMKLAIGFSLLFMLSIGSVYYYGMTLPEQHKISGHRTIDAPVEEVFALVTDPRRATEWRENVKEVKQFEDHGEGRLSWTEDWKDGNSFSFDVTVYSENELYQISIYDFSEVFNGLWSYEFTEKDGRTVVQLTEQGNIPNPLIRGLHKLSADPRAPLETNLDELEAHFADDSD